MFNKGVRQRCTTNVYVKGVRQMCTTNLYDKDVVHHMTDVQQMCDKGVQQMCTTKVYNKDIVHLGVQQSGVQQKCRVHTH